MTEQDIKSIMGFSEKFFKDNDGNRLNEWLSTSYLINLQQRLITIIKADNIIKPNKIK